ncbi:2641_t:CDS:2 [Funneliformis geosporum]|uniref:2641_t:CDS:1 n=1 Tax=Funneliformis geosporum TaxID=1117311 RepID=A0A9W4X1K2_9GLOM|nr:2641_t:CDS:2 [Funneliformis geosporum]
MNKAVRDYKEEKRVARDYLQLIKTGLDDCNCVEEKEGRFDKLESNLDKSRSVPPASNLIKKGELLKFGEGRYPKVREEEIIKKIAEDPNAWSFKRLKIAGGKRDKRTNLLVHDSCKFTDGELVMDYGKFHYKKSFMKEELKKFKEAKKKNYHNLLIVQEGICVRKSYQEKHNFGKKRKKITKLDIKRESLEDKLNLNDFTNLKKLNCESNKLTSLNLTNCEKLEKVNCCDNLLTIGTLLTVPTNLKKLNLSNNPFAGNLDFLTNFKQLKYLDISDTDFNEVNIDKLPKSLEKIEYSTKKRPDYNHDKLDYNERLELGFKNKFSRLNNIIYGLNEIHKQKLVHCDLHSGNILNGKINSDGEVEITSYITDLGLCRPANEINKKKVYGVLPYIAPEVLQGQPYTQKADIYSFGIVVYELPDIDSLKVPHLLKDLIKKCWDADPKQRPTVEELREVINAIKDEYNTFSKNNPYQIPPTAVVHSKPINTKKISELLENSKQNNIAKSVEFDMSELHGVLEKIKEQENNSN